MLTALRALEQMEVSVYSVYFEEQGLDTKSMNSEMFATFPGMVAQQESVSISQNMRWSYKKRMESGEFNCCAPAYGFDLINGKLVINETEAAVIRRIFDLYLQGIGMQTIANILNNEGVRRQYGRKKWHHTTANYVLNNERYKGDALLQKQITTLKQNYTLLQIYLVYDNNENTAYFDGIQLFREEFGHSYVYDSDGNITSVTDLQKKTTTYEYKNNNLTKMVLPSGASQTYTYDSYHNVLTATSPEGVSSSFTYDTYGNNTQVSVGGTKKVTASAAYSADGNQLASVTDALGQTTSYGYDLQTGLLQWVQAPGETESTRTNYSYDGKLRATGVSKGASAVGYSYASDLLSAISTASGTDYSFAYGAFDLVQSIQAGSRTLISHSYSTDGNHQLTRSDYGNGDSVSYGYDSLGRTTSVRYEDGAQVDYTYDNNGNLGLLTDSVSGRRTQYFYDFQDRLMRWEQSGSGYANSVTWGYDDNNNLSTQKQTLNSTTYTTSYTYDKDNRLTKTTEGTVSAGYTYDALGRMTAMDAQNSGKSVVKTTIGYNDPSSTTATGQVRTWKSGATTYTYAYDARGNITSVSDGQSTTTYAYDSFDQLVRENNQAAGKTWTYAYDSGGNILSKTEYAYTTGTLGTAVRTVAYGYGDAGWSDLLTSIGGQSLTADEIGNLLSDGTWTYTWQHGRQLAGMSKTGTSIAYGYDSDGKRITKTVNGTAYNYHYLGDQLVELTWGGNKLHFTYDSTGPLSVNCNGTEYFYVKNAQGDVTGLVNASGTRVVTYTYDAWGNLLTTTGSLAATLGAQNPLRYRGYVYDTETGLYYITRGGVGLSMRTVCLPLAQKSQRIMRLHIVEIIQQFIQTNRKCGLAWMI